MSSSGSPWLAPFAPTAHHLCRRTHGQSRFRDGAHVLDLLLKRNRTSGATLVLVTHDPQVSSHADRRIVLRDGMIVEDTMQGQPDMGANHKPT